MTPAASASHLFSMPWGEVLMPHPSWMEKLARPVLVYGSLLVVFRFGAKRALAQSTLFDFLVVLLISNVVQNAMIGDDNSILGAMAGAIILILLSGAFDRACSISRKARRVLEGRADLLICHGRTDWSRARKLGVAHNDLMFAIRRQGISRVEDVEFAILELDGTISVIPKGDENDKRPHTALPAEIEPEADAKTGARPRPMPIHKRQA